MQNLMRQEWDPVRELATLSDRFGLMFDVMRRPTNGARESMAVTDWVPAVNICETDSEYCLRTELPGVQKNDVSVTLDDSVLTIRGERKQDKEEKSVRWHRRELIHGVFVRQFTLPDDAQDGKIDASFKDGILEVTITKSKAKPGKSRQIAVQ